jgi:hypothetical protein
MQPPWVAYTQTQGAFIPEHGLVVQRADALLADVQEGSGGRHVEVVLVQQSQQKRLSWGQQIRRQVDPRRSVRLRRQLVGVDWQRFAKPSLPAEVVDGAASGQHAQPGGEPCAAWVVAAKQSEIVPAQLEEDLLQHVGCLCLGAKPCQRCSNATQQMGSCVGHEGVPSERIAAQNALPLVGVGFLHYVFHCGSSEGSRWFRINPCVDLGRGEKRSSSAGCQLAEGPPDSAWTQRLKQAKAPSPSEQVVGESSFPAGGVPVLSTA